MKKKAVFAAIAAACVVGLAGCGEGGKEAEASVPETVPAETVVETTEAPEKTVKIETQPEFSPMDLAKDTYQLLDMTAELVDCFGSDLCAAWYTGIWNMEELYEDGIACLEKQVSLTEDELRDGAAYLTAFETDGDFDNISDERLEELRQQANDGFVTAYQEDDMFNYCTNVVWTSYLATGRIDLTMEACAEIKDSIRTLIQVDPESPYAESLKGYYGVVKSYLDWCEDPEGSYNDAEELLRTYRENCNAFVQELDFDLGD